MSLLVRPRLAGHDLATATGFVALAPSGPVLVTNWHVVAGRDFHTDEVLSTTAALPDELEIIHNRAKALGAWVSTVEPLYVGANPRWKEHPRLGRRADMAALPLSNLQDVELYPYDLLGGQPIFYGPAEPVSVIGFPFGSTAGGHLGIWATGFVASEPTVDLDDLPKFLIDCRTRPGQSGSAVIAFRGAGAVGVDGGGTMLSGGAIWRFLGVYSGRIHPESDIGTVWKASAVAEMVDSVTQSSKVSP